MPQEIKLLVDDEVKALGDALKILVVDIKAKKPTAQIVSDVLPSVIASVGNISAIGADIKKVDNQAYLAKCLAEILEPAP